MCTCRCGVDILIVDQTEVLKEIFNNKTMVSLSKYVLQFLDTRFPKDKEVDNASKKRIGRLCLLRTSKPAGRAVKEDMEKED